MKIIHHFIYQAMNKKCLVFLGLLTLCTSWLFGQQWQQVSIGIGCNYIEKVLFMSKTQANDRILMSGYIDTDGNCVSQKAVIEYNGSSILQLSDPSIPSTIISTSVFEFNNHIYASGFLVDQQTNDPYYFNYLDANGQWQLVPQGVKGTIFDVVVKDGIAYLAGGIRFCGDLPAGLVCTYDGDQVLPYYTGTPDTDLVHAVEFYQDTLYIGGVFTGNDGLTFQGYNTCCKIVNGQLEKVQNGLTAAGICTSLEVFDNKLFMGGWIKPIGYSDIHSILYYQNGQIYSLPTEPDFKVDDMRAYNGGLYVSGDFDQLGGQPCYGVARWDGESWTCLNHQPLFDHYNNPCEIDCVRAIEIWNDTLYIGGSFQYMGNTEIKRFAKLNASLSEVFPTHITEASTAAGVFLHPNPATHSLTLTAGQAMPAGTWVQMHDMAGRVVHSERLPVRTTTHTVDVATLAPGVYTCTLQHHSQRYQTIRWVRE